MLIKESFVKQKPINMVLKENGDAMEYYMNHPEEHWDRLIEKFEGSRVKFEHWCHKAYLGPHGPKAADQSKYDKAMAHFDKKTSLSEGLLSSSEKSQLNKQEWLNKQKKSTEYKELVINEAFQYEDILNMKYEDLLVRNNGRTSETLSELNTFMSSIQGTNDTEERKAYFKAQKFYVRLVRDINEKDPKNFKKQIDRKVKKMEKKK